MRDAADGDVGGGTAAASGVRVAVLSSYTSDYELGALSARVNRLYAAAHGYTFICRVCDVASSATASSATLGSEWTTSSRAEHGKHPTWQKVHMIHECLTSLLRPDQAERGSLTGGRAPPGASSSGPPGARSREAAGAEREEVKPAEVMARLPPPGTTHLLWIDADAAVIRHERSVRELLAPLPPTTELVIGEDLTPACLLNAGVLLVRVSEWSLSLWSDVLDGPAAARFHRKPFHEQSVLIEQASLVWPFSRACFVRAPFVTPHLSIVTRSSWRTPRAAHAPPRGAQRRAAVPQLP